MRQICLKAVWHPGLRDRKEKGNEHRDMSLMQGLGNQTGPLRCIADQTTSCASTEKHFSSPHHEKHQILYTSNSYHCQEMQPGDLVFPFSRETTGNAVKPTVHASDSLGYRKVADLLRQQAGLTLLKNICTYVQRHETSWTCPLAPTARASLPRKNWTGTCL